jgi:hypothetical protein
MRTPLDRVGSGARLAVRSANVAANRATIARSPADSSFRFLTGWQELPCYTCAVVDLYDSCRLKSHAPGWAVTLEKRLVEGCRDGSQPRREINWGYSGFQALLRRWAGLLHGLWPLHVERRATT